MADRRRPPAVVVGLDTLVGLQTARRLAARAVPVIGLATNPDHFAVRTRACRRIVVTAPDDDAVVEAVAGLATTSDHPPVVVPCYDGAVLALSAQRAELGGARLPLPSHDIVVALSDKAGFHRLAARAGLAVPATVSLGTGWDDLEEAAATVGFPCVLKPVRRDRRWQQASPAKAFRADDHAALGAAFGFARRHGEHFVLQRWIDGAEPDLLAANTYLDASGRALATFVSGKLRQWPPETGSSSSGVSVDEPQVRDLTLALLSSVGSTGLAYLELKRDRARDELVAIEANIGRPTGRSALAEACGVPLLETMYCDLVGDDLPPPGVQRNGVKWVYLRGDLQAAWRAHRSGTLTAAEWWRSLRGPRVFAELSRRDPWPFVADLRRGLTQIVRASTNRRRRGEPLAAGTGSDAKGVARGHPLMSPPIGGDGAPSERPPSATRR